MAKRIEASAELIGKRITRTDGTKTRIVDINTYGYKVADDTRQIPANKVLKKGRGFIEATKADPVNAVGGTGEETPASKTPRRKPKTSRNTNTTRTQKRGGLRRKTKEQSKPKANTKPKREVKNRKAVDETLDVGTVADKKASKPNTRAKKPVVKKPVPAFTKNIISSVYPGILEALSEHIAGIGYDLVIKSDTLEYRFNNNPDADDSTLDGPICRMAFDLIPTPGSIELPEEDVDGIILDEDGSVDLTAFDVFSDDELQTLADAFARQAKNDVNVGSFTVGCGVLHPKTDTLFALVGYTGKVFILINLDTSEVKRINKKNLISACEYIDLSEYFSGNVDADLESNDDDFSDELDDDLLEEDDDGEEEEDDEYEDEEDDSEEDEEEDDSEEEDDEYEDEEDDSEEEDDEYKDEEDDGEEEEEDDDEDFDL